MEIVIDTETALCRSLLVREQHLMERLEELTPEVDRTETQRNIRNSSAYDALANGVFLRWKGILDEYEHVCNVLYYGVPPIDKDNMMASDLADAERRKMGTGYWNPYKKL